MKAGRVRQSMATDEGWDETVHGYWMKGRSSSPHHSTVTKGDIVLVATNTIMTFCFCAALSSDGSKCLGGLGVYTES